ncbi:MAG: TrkH family potassium uptake protein, partial [Ruminococcus sp.]|nr:TrkH family potassium uptake protein [Ruminococcus sp.]
FTHWIGGMGVLVFIMAFLPLSGAKNIHLMRAESPGPSVSKLVPRVKTTALLLYSMYLVLTILELILLMICRMPLFDALCITFGTAGTGGFGVLNDSIASYSSSVQIIVTVFMALFGVNFNVYFFILCRKWKDIFCNSEIRIYFILIAVITALIFWNIGDTFSSVSEAIKHISFTVVSLITTTGYSTVDFNTWTEFSRTLLLLLMLTGACAGSTSGGIKISRFLILIKGMRNGIKKMIHPNQVRHTEMDGKTISKDTVQTVNLYMIFYVFLFIISCIIISLDNYDFLTNFSSVIAALSNVGPGFGQAGPSSNFGIFSEPSKWILMFDMIAGRLELFPVLVLFSPHTWKR